MKFFISIITIGILSFIIGLYAPWWSLAIVAFVVALFINQQPFSSFLSGFLGVFILWLLLALFINAANDSILANRIGGMFGIGQSSILLAFISAFVGGLVAGFAALSASYLRTKK
ncbi:hypothetical protein [Niabella ginsengisoli]|uniref:Uncharacterized protein n=1 Tax=Niabella ginsengisoli TaxID=522298 RepID=A0ABS9SHD0_9BACT|nr:hypothetical protein [Niabella ginsengisoli]MCH5597778.1 hypothetical protein [Niabella ginsengisoli]